MAAAIVPLSLYRRCRQMQMRRHGLRWSAVLGLVVALQFMQVLGLLHGIAHAGWPPGLVNVAQASFNAALFDYIDGAAEEVEGVVTPASADSANAADGNSPDSSAQHTGHHHHSCVEYDAASATTGVHVSFFAPPLLPGTSVLALWQAFASWDAPFASHFSSRAPPC